MIKSTLSLTLAGLLLTQVGFAERTPQSELDILSAEADDAAAEKVQSAPAAISEPGVEATSDAETDKLSDAVTSQLSKILGESSGDTIDAETEDKIEKVISSSLLSGADMADIKNAVSSAMTELKTEGGENISEEKIANAAKSIDKLVGSEDKTDEAEDSYLASLRAEADEVNDSESKKTEVPTVAAVKPESVTEKEKPKKEVVAKTVKADAEAEESKESFLNVESVTVLKGESLYKIALRVYGNGSMYARLYEANKDTVLDPNLINVGQVLRVPR